MKRTTVELYGQVSEEMLEKRKNLAEYFINKAKARVTKLQDVRFEDRDDALINDCLNAQTHWARLRDEEI